MWQKCHIFFYVACIPKHNVLNLLLRSAADEINEYVMAVHTSKEIHRSEEVWSGKVAGRGRRAVSKGSIVAFMSVKCDVIIER